jgi:hypothetical protein
MSAIPVAVGALALVWLVKTIFTTMKSVVGLIETLLTFPEFPAHDR